MELIKITLNKREITQPLIINQYNKNHEYVLDIYNSDGTPYNFVAGDYIVMEFAVGQIAIIMSGSDFTLSGNKATFKIPRELTLNSGKGTYNVAIVNSTNESRIASFKRTIIVESNSIDENTVSTELIVTAKENLDASVTVAESTKISLDASIASGNLDNYQLKEPGKGLSTNDYDNTEKTEVAKIKDKQDKTDNTLNTTSKTIVGAINELNTNKADASSFSFTGDSTSGYEIRNNIVEINLYVELTGTEKSITLPTTIGTALVATITPLVSGTAVITSITNTTISAKMSGTDTRNCFIFIKALKATT